MPQPLDGRVLFAVPVQVIGVTPSGTAFSETAYTIDVSRYGVRLDKVHFLRRPGDHVTLRYAERSARYRVAWVGTPDTPRAGQAGLAILDGEPFLWGTETPVRAEHRDLAVPDNAHGATAPAMTRPTAAVATPGAAASPAKVPLSPAPAQNRPTPAAVVPSGLAPSPRERRTTRRYLCDRAVLCWRDGERVPIWGKLRDLSLGGCFAETPVPFAAGTVVSLMMMMFGYKIRARAQVRIHQPGEGMGLQFLPLRQEDLYKLKQVLAGLPAPGEEPAGILHNEDSVFTLLRCWFEENGTLSRDQFWSLLECRNPPK